MLIIDSHLHAAENWFEPIESGIHQMDANGVTHAVLIQQNGAYDNSYVLNCVKHYGKRFKAVVLISPKEKEKEKKLEELHKQGASGVRVLIRDQGDWEPTDGVYKLAGELGMVVSVIGNPEDFAGAKFKKLLDNCPKTQFNLEHLARSAKPEEDVAKPPHTGYKEALEVAKWPNTTVRVPGLGEIVKRPRPLPPGFPFVKVPPLFEMCKEAFGVQRMMWGSHFPACSALEGYRNVLNGVRNHPAFKNGDDAEWVMGKSAAKL